MAGLGQSQAGAIGSSAFHPDGVQAAERAHPLHQVGVTGRGGGDSASASRRPFISATAAWWVSLWVSTPPVIRRFFGFFAMRVLTSSREKRAGAACRTAGRADQ
jgi:hypothetical protein